MRRFEGLVLVALAAALPAPRPAPGQELPARWEARTCTRGSETSTLLYLRPDLVQMERATDESGANQKRLALPDLYTAI